MFKSVKRTPSVTRQAHEKERPVKRTPSARQAHTMFRENTLFQDELTGGGLLVQQPNKDEAAVYADTKLSLIHISEPTRR
eukprot:295005-Heterocapsa_arctica.AAC.1